MLTPVEEAISLDRKSPYLKAHMLDGQVYVLTNWTVDAEKELVLGQGEQLDLNRKVVQDGEFIIAISEVAIFETNVVEPSPSIRHMSIITGISLVGTALCVANPKACFGSCPTFYTSDGENAILQAEGFSSSVTPALEAADLDSLYRARPMNGELALQMKNEALETHVVRYVHLLAVPRSEGARVVATSNGEFWQTQSIQEPTRCFGPEGNCLNEVRGFDGTERFSEADPIDLATQEIMELEFSDIPEGNLGLVIASRQSLMSTFLFYQTLAYMGRSAADWLVHLERGDKRIRDMARGIYRELGGIEVLVQDRSGAWKSAGEIYETGPLASDVKVIPIPSILSGNAKIRLRLAKGLWRLDYLGLASLTSRADPIRILPSSVLYKNNEREDAKELLLDSSRVLTMVPGDQYTIIYRLPEEPQSYEFFLESRGYYLEWMREEWLAEEDQSRVNMIFRNPRKALQVLAPKYKKLESTMENVFWNSRYGQQ